MTSTPSRPIFVVAGARSFSLGAALADKLASEARDSVILTVDSEPAPSSHPNIVARKFDLNPLQHPNGFEGWSAELYGLVRSVHKSVENPPPVQAVFLGVARYDVSEYVSSTAADRAQILGSNILGKFEILHAVMRLNFDLGFDNATVLGVFDIGSLHGLLHTANRSLYVSTKAASLALCRVLVNGSEVRNAVHIAPGRIDTPMLHWNHWVLKENGDRGFPDLVRQHLPSLYDSVFRDGDANALASALSQLGLEEAENQAVLGRYNDRRKMNLQTEEGIISPESLASYLASLMLDAGDRESGIVEVTAPLGCISVVRRPF